MVAASVEELDRIYCDLCGVTADKAPMYSVTVSRRPRLTLSHNIFERRKHICLECAKGVVYDVRGGAKPFPLSD